jgi:DNA mismatch repair ATPase MutL
MDVLHFGRHFYRLTLLFRLEMVDVNVKPAKSEVRFGSCGRTRLGISTIKHAINSGDTSSCWRRKHSTQLHRRAIEYGTRISLLFS